MNGRVPVGRRILQPVLRFLIWLLLRMQIRGTELMPDRSGGILYYNHIHWLDPALICGSARRYVVPLAKIEARDLPVVGRALRWYHVVFISRGLVDRAALQATWQVLKDGDVAVISPEGTRSQNGGLQAAKEGLAFIARQVPEAWLMPCAVTGTPAFSLRLSRLWRRPRVTLTYGRPFRFRWPAEKTTREALRDMTDQAMYQMAALLPPGMRGDYDASDRAACEWLEFLEA